MLPLIVVCVGVLIGVLTACLTVLELNDIARVTARSVATAAIGKDEHQKLEKRCRCKLLITSTNDIITIRTTRAFSFPLIGISIPFTNLHAESFAMQEPAVIFQAPSD